MYILLNPGSTVCVIVAHWALLCENKLWVVTNEVPLTTWANWWVSRDCRDVFWAAYPAFIATFIMSDQFSLHKKPVRLSTTCQKHHILLSLPWGQLRRPLGAVKYLPFSFLLFTCAFLTTAQYRALGHSENSSISSSPSRQFWHWWLNPGSSTELYPWAIFVSFWTGPL